MKTKVTIPWTRPSTDEECTLRCEVYGGSKPTRDDPGDPPEVEVLAVIGEDGRDRPDLVDEAQEDIDPGSVIEAAQERIEGERLAHYDLERKSRLEDRP